MQDAKHDGIIIKMRLEATSSTTHSKTSEISVKSRNRYLDHSKDRSKQTFLIHGHGHSSYECKFLGYSVTKCAKGIPTKDRRQEYPATKTILEDRKRKIL